MAADRASVVAEEREGMGRLLAMLSSAINTELPSRLRKIVREELAQASGAIAAAAVPPVVAAVQAALPKVRPGGTWQREFSPARPISPCVVASLVCPLCAPARTMYRPPARCTARPHNVPPAAPKGSSRP